MPQEVVDVQLHEPSTYALGSGSPLMIKSSPTGDVILIDNHPVGYAIAKESLPATARECQW